MAMANEPIAMDIHMKGISFSVNKHQLDAELATILHRQPYADFSTVGGPVNFHVYLFKDRNGENMAHSGSGSLTLLRDVALRFLQEYGEPEPPNTGLPLKIFKIGGRRVKFSPGRSTPRLEVVERILRFPYADPRVAEKKEQRATALQTENILLRTLQFGWACRDSVFSVEWEADITGGSLHVNDERREFRITIPRPSEVFYIGIRFSRISHVQIHSDRSQPSTIFFNLSEPPNFECGTGSGPRQRLSYLPIEDHKRVAPFTSLAIRLVCSNRGDVARFERLAKTAGIKNVYETELHVERRGLFSEPVLEQVRAGIKSLRWNVAFQVEALHRNLDLDAKEILSILPSTIPELFKEVHAEYSRSHAKAPSLEPADNSVFQSLHVVITPTTIYLQERSNRVIRSFPKKHHESFLRVIFEDEGGLKYRFDKELDCAGFTRYRVGEFLIENGLTIAGRKFDFLAYSQSALKEHAVWFVRDFTDKGKLVTAESIIENLGSFDGLTFDPTLRYCPARYAARISQAFTATDTTSVEVEEIIYLEEISDSSGKYHFTDGVGTMSLELAKDIGAELGASRRRKRRVKNHPTAYQIRWAGCKGMLSVDHQLKGHVPYEVFKEYQDNAVLEVQRSTRSLQAFARMLEIHGLGTAYRLPSVLLGLNQLGLDTLPGNKFYQKMLNFAVHHVLRLLKTKARIPVKDAVTVVGVADVHRFLKEGEIFVCTRDPDSNKLNYLEGDILISRSPTIHPGDVQQVRAIGKPPPGSCFDIQPLPNTVVFSVLGKRPLPSYLGGGDLDGDTYNLIPLNKCPRFLPQESENIQTCTMVDVAEFVIDYINSDALGMVATNWLLIADASEMGIFDPDCMRLAALHSDAVDYPKTGQPVAIGTIPKPKTKLRPDWHAPEVYANMDEFYQSQRAIGKLFRAIKLPDVEPDTLSRFERRMIKAGRLTAPPVDDLAETLDGLNLDGDPMMLAIKACVGRFISTNDRPPETVEYISQIFNRYASEFQGICIAHTLSHGKTALLSEEEAVVGTIVAKTSQPRKRTDLIASLREKSDLLVRSVKDELAGDDEVSWEECLQRAWLSFQLAIDLAYGEHKATSFGAQSFLWIALGAILDALKELEDDAKASRGSRSTRGSSRRH
ncbi:RNA-dependent RNA polymerase [Mycena venus]|uniref:RNA-dependent RNA polymerase n=1 Tax=Mycena venus TaxID=2733690 RepID=A0A8H7CL29_9AGAR|nr:RNA-dependent RNA polymerase [Mycena venus]